MTRRKGERLNAIVKEAISKGIVWGNNEDPRWNAYDDGPDPVTWLKEVWPVRDALLAHYGPQMLRPGQPNSLLASRFPLIYLFHRYALAAAIKVIGSATVPLLAGRRWAKAGEHLASDQPERSIAAGVAGAESIRTRNCARAVELTGSD